MKKILITRRLLRECEDKAVSVRRLGSNNTQTETIENFIEKFQNITKSPIEEK